VSVPKSILAGIKSSVSPSSSVLKTSDAPAEGAKTAIEAAAAVAPRPLDHAGAQDGDSPPRIEAAAAIAPRPLEPRLQDVDDLVNDCPSSPRLSDSAGVLPSKKEGQTVDLPRPGLTVPGSCSSHARDVEDDIDTNECDECRLYQNLYQIYILYYSVLLSQIYLSILL
jgi:hypothetical protein